MIKLVCLTLPYAKFSLERGIEGVARAGYSYVGLGWSHMGEDTLGFDPDGPLVHRAKALCEDAGLTPLVIGRGPISATHNVQQLVQRIDVCRALGAEAIQMAGAGGYRRFPCEPLAPDVFQAAHETFVSDMKTAGTHARDKGIILALKPHTGNTATAKHLARLLPEIDRPSVRACYDPGNVRYYEGVSPEDDFPHIASQTYKLIAKDHRGSRAENNFPIPGGGDVDFERVFATAFEAGFDGPVVVERVDGTGGNFTAEEIDRRIQQARENVVKLLTHAGFSQKNDDSFSFPPRKEAGD